MDVYQEQRAKNMQNVYNNLISDKNMAMAPQQSISPSYNPKSPEKAGKREMVGKGRMSQIQSAGALAVNRSIVDRDRNMDKPYNRHMNLHKPINPNDVSMRKIQSNNVIHRSAALGDNGV